MDFVKLKESLLQDTTAEERVEVNQRHLIDKILARYSAEFTVFRELLQNSNDAGASAAQIIFKTNKEKQPKSTFLWLSSTTTSVESITYKNNGRPFSEDDFTRLRKIAEGNPDEQKIGFFGVVYESYETRRLSSITSGVSSMAFLWKNDMLYTKRGSIPQAQRSEWTSFFLSMRETTDLPNMDQFLKFLVSSLAFVTNLKTVEVFENDQRLLFLHRKAKPAIPLELPSSTLFKFSSPQGLFHLRSISIEKVQLDVQVTTNGRDPNGVQHTVYLRVAAGHVETKLPKKLVDEMNRTTKKNPPTSTQVRIMFSNHDEYESSHAVRKSVDYFHSLIPSPDGQGRVFIGFPTHQTTGFAGLLACHLIPTVERESIDFVDPALNYWNQEMLCVSGILARIIYENELNEVHELYSGMNLDPSSQTWLRKRANHALASFTFRSSTPSSLVGQVISGTFFQGATCPFRIMSTRGLLNARDVRIPDETVQSFCQEIPFVTPETMQDCKELIDRLIAARTLTHVRVDDVLQELGKRPLTVEECISFMKWWIGKIRSGIATVAHIHSLKMVWKYQQDNKTILLQSITHFGHARIAGGSGLPLPPYMLPLELSQPFSDDDLNTCFWSWKPLSVMDWAQFITSDEQFIQSPPFTEKVMSVLSRHYTSGSLSNEDKTILVSLLCETTCIITQFGMKKPSQSYFKNVTLFEDLPIVAFSGKIVSDTLLKALGVREHVDLQVVFGRLDDLNWNQVQLIKYLASVNSKLEGFERERLRNSNLFLAESSSPSDKTPVKRYKAGDLFEPKEFFVELGLPVLQWSGKWRSHSEEGKFMSSLGLCDIIPQNSLLDLIAKESNDAKRLRLLKYFVDQYEMHYKKTYSPDRIGIPFLPTTTPGLSATPRDCFTDPRVKVMGYNVLLSSLCLWAHTFGVAEAPRGSLLVKKLGDSPPTIELAKETFSFLSSRQHDFSSSDWSQLKTLRFIPISLSLGNGRSSTEHVAPSTVYFKGTQENSSVYGSHFTYIDFGDASCHAFLRACGVKDQPSPQELAMHVVEDPKSFLTSLGFERYLNLLREIAANFSLISRDSRLITKMKSTPFLVGIQGGMIRHTQEAGESTSDSSKSLDSQVKCSLDISANISLIDDTVLSQLFTPLSAPMDHLLEPMYFSLGSRWISSQVTESHAVPPSSATTVTSDSEKLQSVIRQRAPILLYDGHQMRPSAEVVSSVNKLLDSIHVFSVPTIEIVRVFRGTETKRSKTTAASTPTKKGQVLLITPGFDYYDVANVLGKLMLKKPRLNDFLLISTLLSSSLENLRLKGFPVDRILNLQASLLKNQPIVMENQIPRPIPKEQDPSSTSTSAGSKSRDQLFQELVSIFPDADPQYLQSQLDRYKNSSDFVQLVEQMLQNGYPKKPSTMEKPAKQESNMLSQVLEIFPDVDPEFVKNLISRVPPPRLEDVINYMTAKGYPKKQPQVIQQQQGNSGGFFSSIEQGLTQTLGTNLLQNASSWMNNLSLNSGNMTQAQSTLQNRANTPPVISSTRTDQIQSSLKKAIQSTRGTNQSGFKANIPLQDAPEPKMFQNECRARSEQDLLLVKRVQNTPVYVDRSCQHVAQVELDRESGSNLERFVTLLHQLADVFELPGKGDTIHVYWDSDGSTIAFNANRALFFNFRFFVGLHVPRGKRQVKSNSTMASLSSREGTLPGAYEPNSVTNSSMSHVIYSEAPSAYYYWFLTFCHELAHNFVSAHNSDHEFWMSSFAETYMGRLFAKLCELGVI